MIRSTPHSCDINSVVQHINTTPQSFPCKNEVLGFARSLSVYHLIYVLLDCFVSLWCVILLIWCLNTEHTAFFNVYFIMSLPNLKGPCQRRNTHRYSENEFDMSDIVTYVCFCRDASFGDLTTNMETESSSGKETMVWHCTHEESYST